MRFCSGRAWALELPRAQWALATHRSSRTPRSSRERDIQVRRTGSKRHTLDYHTDTRETSEKLFGALSSGREMICNGLEVTDRTRVKISLVPTHTLCTPCSLHTHGGSRCVCVAYTHFAITTKHLYAGFFVGGGRRIAGVGTCCVTDSGCLSPSARIRRVVAPGDHSPTPTHVIEVV